MGISRFYVIPMIIKRKTRTKIGGVMKETINVIASLNGAFDKTTTSYAYQSDKETFNFTHVAEMPTSTDVLEDDIIEVDGKEYNVVSVINNLYRNHHLEILCLRSS